MEIREVKAREKREPEEPLALEMDWGRGQRRRASSGSSPSPAGAGAWPRSHIAHRCARSAGGDVVAEGSDAGWLRVGCGGC